MAGHLKHGLRTSDIAGHTGSDALVVIALGPTANPAALALEMERAGELLLERPTRATIGDYEPGSDLGDYRYAGASAGVAAVIPDQMSAEEAIKRAGCEMSATQAAKRWVMPARDVRDRHRHR